MYKFVEHCYGADSEWDCNYTMPLVSYIIEPSDKEQIQRQILEAMDASGELPSDTFTISLIEPISEEQVELTINPFKYLTKEDCMNYLALFGSNS